MAELFTNFEVNRTPRWRRLAQLVALSLVFHVVAIAGAIYIPAIRQALNIAGLISGADYVDEAYDKTIIGDRAELITLSPDGKLHYPPGYFKRPAPPAPQIIAEAKPTPTPKPKPTPTPTPSPEPSVSPAATPQDGVTAANDKPLTEEEKKEKELDEIARAANIDRPPKINSRPFKDLLAKYKKMKDEGQINLDGTIEMIINADRRPDGTLTNIKPKLIKGDPKLVNAALDFVSALSDSRALVFLKDTKHLVMRVKANEANVSVTASTEVESAALASVMSFGFNTLVKKASDSPRDEAVYYRSTNVTSSGKQVIVNFSMSRAEATTALKKGLPAS
ncbi:MAG: hypothetical protein ICV68_01555 [Pyrinomonadaceae bacterium]|nr:hypothetical protein [Pyrinomonadaceae bacterium]